MSEGERLWLRACWAYLDPNRMRTEPYSFRRMAICLRDLGRAGIARPDGLTPMPDELRYAAESSVTP